MSQKNLILLKKEYIFRRGFVENVVNIYRKVKESYAGRNYLSEKYNSVMEIGSLSTQSQRPRTVKLRKQL